MSEPGVQETYQPRDRANEQPWDVKWGIVYHRIAYSKANGKQCECKDCQEYIGYIHEKYWA